MLKKIRERLLKARAGIKGMTVPEYKRYMKRQKAERKRFKEALQKKEREEKLKHQKWKIEQKYKKKREPAKKREKAGLSLEYLFGKPSKTSADPFGLFGSPKPKRKKRKKKGKRKK